MSPGLNSDESKSAVLSPGLISRPEKVPSSKTGAKVINFAIS
tara:strand:+ start:585 stop:710 length:126 start_codon:yes stop_codon:yes gene_type:complete